MTRSRTVAAGGLLLVLLSFGCTRTSRPAPAEAPRFDLEETTIADLQTRMERGQETARSLVDKYLARIESLDRNGPGLHSVIEINPDARAIADRLDAERREGRVRGPLHGIPILIKDNIATADGMMTTAGSLALEGAKPPSDAFVAAQLRRAGAVILGKTNLSEWANFRSTHSTSGWSGRGGQTKNPYALDRSPSGSSSGSGAAVSANLAAAAIGTETDGSIVSPSSVSGLVGIKPTLGLVSRAGIIPIAHSQDTAGPMARTVADAARLLGAITGSDPSDIATSESDARRARDYTTFLDAGGLKGARIGVVRKRLTGYLPSVDRVFDEAVNRMKALGAIVIDPADIPDLGEYDGAELEVLLYEFKDDLNRYLAWLGPDAPVHSMQEIIEFNASHAEREMPYFAQELMERAQKKGPLSEAAYRTARDKSQRLARGGIDAVMEKYSLDALIAPTEAPAWPIDPIDGDHFLGGSSTPAAVAGYPHITVPAGQVFGLPVGVSFFGRPWSEPILIKLAFAYEQATKHRKPPAFAPAVKLQ
jgi:amidase